MSRFLHIISARLGILTPLILTPLILTAIALHGCARSSDRDSAGASGANIAAQSASLSSDSYADNGRVFVGMSVESQDALPPCDRPMAGRIVYVAAEKSFLACGDTGQWRTDKAGTESVWQKAFNIHRKFRAGIIRIATQCEDRAGSKSTHVGSGFHCAPGIVCTDRHVLDCPEGAALVRINLHRVVGEEDATGDDATEMPPPFYTIQDNAIAESQISRHPDRDLAKIKLANAGPGISSMPLLRWKESPVNTGDLGHAYTLSMSYPLGFTAPYAQIGALENRTDNRLDNARTFEFSTTNDLDIGSAGSPIVDLDGQVIGVIVPSPPGPPASSGRATGTGTRAIDASLLSAF